MAAAEVDNKLKSCKQQFSKTGHSKRSYMVHWLQTLSSVFNAVFLQKSDEVASNREVLMYFSVDNYLTKLYFEKEQTSPLS